MAWIRTINHHFLAWKEIGLVSAKNRGLVSLMRRRRIQKLPELPIAR